MKKYTPEDFKNQPTCLMYRVDTQIQNMPIDIYLLIEFPSELVLTFSIVEDTINKEKVQELINNARGQKLINKIILANGDPAQEYLTEICNELNISVEYIPKPYLEDLVASIKKFFGEHFFSPSSMAYQISDEVLQDAEFSREDLIASLPDSYSPCSCNSGKKYKFCCKKIFREVGEAMVAAEDGNLDEALQLIERARDLVGDTAEVICREAIVYSYSDKSKLKATELLQRCLTEFPNYPRAHYIHGINLKNSGNFLEAIEEYKKAISLYPTSDILHLNESYNNLGSAYYEVGNIKEAQLAWEKALFFMPSDTFAKNNLKYFIYDVMQNIKLN